MKRVIIVILLLASLYSEAQIINASPAYRPVEAASCSYLLDQYSGAAAAYSLRKLDCDYSGYAIKVRRSSDNTEQDIGFTSNGDLDTASLKSFVGSNSGYVVTWYDQSGNSNNVTQSTAGNQPQIVDNGVFYRQGTKPAMYLSGSSFFYISNQISSEVVFTHFVAGTRQSTSSKFNSFGSNHSSSHPMPFLLYNDGNIYVANSSGWRGVSDNTYGRILVDVYYDNSSNWQLYINNTAKTLSAKTNLTGGNYFNYVGRRQGDITTGYLQEIIHYESDKSSSSTEIRSNINSYYSIY